MLADDVMRSARVLVGDLLQVLPVLLYQGADDGQDGPAGTNAWLRELADFDELRDFERQVPELWFADGDGADATPAAGAAAGWRRAAGLLTQVVVRNAGHMAPHDQPRATQTMIQTWVQGVLQQADIDAAAGAGTPGVTPHHHLQVPGGVPTATS